MIAQGLIVADSLLGQSSEDLVTRAREGDRQAFEELYLRYQGRVVRRLTHLTGPGVQVADLVQETFIRAYRSLPRLRSDALFGQWVLRIATNVARSHHRRCRRRIWRLWERAEDEAEVPGPCQSVDATYPDLRVVHRALNELSHPLREAVVLFEIEGLSLAEMAVTLSVSLNTAASRLRRGRTRLRRSLEKMGFSTPTRATVALCNGEPP